MTTNVERTAETITGSFITHQGDGLRSFGEHAAEALNAEGRIMPDPPTPHTVSRYPGSVCWEVCTDPSVAARRHIGVRVDHTHRIKVNIVGEASPAEAREAAYALLAAADHAEQEQNNV